MGSAAGNRRHDLEEVQNQSRRLQNHRNSDTKNGTAQGGEAVEVHWSFLLW